MGIGHTRWATHGRPTDENAHPHTDGSGTLVVVHNGIIENYLPIKEHLQAEGHRFASETDTEVIAHLIERHLRDAPRLEEAVRRALRELRGSYAIVVLSMSTPDRLIAAKQGAGSVVVGLGQGETFLASDIPAILSHTRDVVVLEDEDVAVVTRHGVEIAQLDGAPVERAPIRILWDPILAEKGGYRHFMLKEIYEQPRAVADTLRGRVQQEGGTVVLPDIELDPDIIQGIQRVVLVACGTSYHAAIVGRFMIERLAGIASEVDLGSEFRYRDAVMGPDGRPWLTPVWFNHDGEKVLLNLAEHRKKTPAVRNNPQVTILLMNPQNPYHWLTIKATAEREIHEDDPDEGHRATETIDQSWTKYVGAEPPYGLRDPTFNERRVLFECRVDRVATFGKP